MATQTKPQQNNQQAPRGRMVAGPEDPWVGVHVLTEHIFCPRAGLIMFEQKVEDDGDEDSSQEIIYSPRAFSYLPIYHLPEIERILEIQLKKLWWRLLLPGIVLIVAVFGLVGTIASFGFRSEEVLGLLEMSGFFLFLSSIAPIKQLMRIVHLQRMRRTAIDAKPHEPDENAKKNQTVNWWQLLKSGFDSVSYKDVLRDEKWHVSGKPWRVLRRGDLRIPVFKKRFCDGPNGTKLYRQHYARIAAYCRLLEQAEGGRSPYGIILFGNSYDGIAISNDPRSRKVFHENLLAARATFRGAAGKKAKSMPKPKVKTLCRGCKLGKPFVYRPGETEHYRFEKQLPVYDVEGDDERDYHSACGDRFHWIPPHDKAYDKGLL